MREKFPYELQWHQMKCEIDKKRGKHESEIRLWNERGEKFGKVSFKTQSLWQPRA